MRKVVEGKSSKTYYISGMFLNFSSCTFLKAGNTRIQFSDLHGDGQISLNAQDGEVMQVLAYYPFGMTIEGLNPAGSSDPEHRYRYNGKEEEPNSRMYDYGARWYMADIGSWGVVDPLASEFSSFSPYSYGFLNPLKYTDPTGMAPQDIIDIDKATGNITVTKAAGDDVVRLVSNGNVESTYTYGSNGSFNSENTIFRGSFGGIDGIAVQSTNAENAQTFYEFAAKSAVEFGKVDVVKDGEKLSVVTTTGEADVTSSLPKITSALSKLGFTGIKQSHSHPDGQSVPSGHYANVPGNPYSLNPVPPSHRDYSRGDAQNARQTRSLPGFQNIKFEVYNPRTGAVTKYDGINKARIEKK